MSLEVTIPILQAGKTAAELASLNPIGFERQLVFETDTLKAKLLDGVTAYNSLPYLFINASVVWGGIGGTLSNQTDLQNALNAKQATLVNQTNIKSINGNSLLGSGDLSITTDLSAYLTIANAASTYATIASLSSYLTTAAAASTYVPYIGATQDVDLGEFELKAGQIEYDQTPTGAAGVAVTRWNDSIGTLETTLKGGNVVLKHGRDLFERVVNKTGIQLTKAAYQAVRVSTAQGQRLGVALAQANNDNNSADTIGLVVETIDNNQEGMIYVVGEINGINTTGSLQSETWADGDVLYLSPTTAGTITNVKPIAPQHLVVIGYVVYSHATQGKIYVKVMNGFELGELHDVDTTGATNGQVLKYNGSIWTAQTDLNSGVWGSITGTLSSQTDLQSALDGKVDENAAITGATKTKITYDAKGLVTAGADATTADIAASTDKNYVTDAQLTVIGNTSGTNSGNQTLANTSDATSHTVTLSATGGSFQLVEGSGITLTTTGTAADGIITIASSGGGGSTFADNVFEIYDNTDNTKKLAFEASGITTGTTRTLTIPNASGTIALTSDLASYVPYTGATGAVNLGANNLTVDTNTFFVDATNNRVGIGTATPNNALTVTTNGTSQSNAGFISQFYQGTTNTDVKIMMADAANFISITYGGTTTSNTQWAGFTMGSGNAAFRVWGSDNVGIGFTNGNLVTNKFQVSGNSRFDGLLRFATDTSAAVALKRNGTELQVRLADDSGFATLISGRFEANQTNISINSIATAITNGSFIGANIGGQQFGLLMGTNQSGYSYIQGRYLSAAEHIRIQEFGSGISVGSATGDGYIAIGRTSQLALSRLGIPIAPTASANYGMVSLGSGAFDGATSGFFTGVAAGTVIAVNLASGGTSDLLNMQVAGVNRFKVSSVGQATISGNLVVDTNTLFVDATNDRVGIGTATPAAILHANSSGGATDLFRVDLAGVRKLRITSTGSVGFSSNNTGFYEGTSTGFDFSNTNAPAATQSAYNFYGRTSTNATGESTHFDMGGKNIAATTGFARSSGTGSWIGGRLDYTINNTGTYSGTVTGFYLNATETSITGTTHNLLNLLVGGSSMFRVNNTGVVSINTGITDASAQLQVNSTTKGFAMPRMTGAQVEAISTPLESLLAYATNAGSSAVKAKGWWGYDGSNLVKIKTGLDEIMLAISDETTALTTGTSKITFRMPYAMKITEVRANLATAQTSGNIFTVDINDSGVSILSTKLTIDNTEKTSTTATTAAVISDVDLADDAEITIDIDQIGDGTAKGCKVTILGYRV